MGITNFRRIREYSPIATEKDRFSGRVTLYTDFTEITQDNIVDVIDELFMDIFDNYVKIKKLKNYEKGLQPIINRKKKVRSDINNHTVVNHAHEFKEFKKGFIYGEPITFAQRASKDISGNDEKKDDKGVSQLNEMFFEQSKEAKDLKLADEFCTCGVGYRFVAANEDKDEVSAFKIYILESEYTFVAYTNDVFRRKILAGTFTIKNSGDVILGCYTNEYYFELNGGEGLGGWKLTKVENNGYKIIPIVEYKYDDQKRGCFESAIPVLNALNTAESDRVNGVAQFVQALLWLNNCKMSEKQYQSLLDLGCVQTDDVTDQKKASIQYLTAELDQTSTQTLIDDLYNRALQIVGAPGRDQSTGGNTGQAIMLSGGWTSAETQAQSSEDIYKESEREFLKVVLEIIRKSKKASPELKNLKCSDIDITFGRNRTDNLLTKTQGLLNMLEAGIHPRIAFACCGLFADNEQAYNDSIPYLTKWEVKDTAPKRKDTKIDPTTGEQIQRGKDNNPPAPETDGEEE